MKLLSTEIGENSIELAYADNPELDAASMLVIVRVPLEITVKRTIGWHQVQALDKAIDFLDGERRAVSNKLGTL